MKTIPGSRLENQSGGPLECFTISGSGLHISWLWATAFLHNIIGISIHGGFGALWAPRWLTGDTQVNIELCGGAESPCWRSPNPSIYQAAGIGAVIAAVQQRAMLLTRWERMVTSGTRKSQASDSSQCCPSALWEWRPGPCIFSIYTV